MRLRSPAEFYIKALLVHPDGYSVEEVKEILDDLDLMPISLSYITRIRNKMRPPPDPFYPDDPGHLPSFRYVVTNKIHTIFQRTVPMKTALELLKVPRSKEFTEALMLVNIPSLAISTHLTRHYRTYCTVDALELYKHYFWNIDLCTTTCMRILLQLEMEAADETNPELKGRQRILTRAYYKDARRVAADMPHSLITATLVQERLGTCPVPRDLAQFLMESRNMASLRMGEAAHQDGPGDSVKYLNYANGVRISEEIIQMTQNPQDQMRNQLQSIALRTDTKPIPSIHTLSQGRHTVDVAPIKDLANDEPDPDATPGH
jgi:hypothetical protein